MNNSTAVTKYGAYSLLLILTFVLENSRGLSVELFGGGIRTAPFIIVAIAAFEGPFAAGILGFAAGIMESIHSPFLEGLISAEYVLYIAVFGFLSERYLRPVLSTVMLGSVIFMTINSLVHHVFYYGLVHNLTFLQGMQHMFFEILLSLVPGGVMFFFVRRIHRRFSPNDGR